jgi:hypothetical protein
MLLIAELEMHWINLSDHVHMMHQAMAIILRVLVTWNLIQDVNSTFECMFCKEPFTNDRPGHILTCRIIELNAKPTN